MERAEYRLINSDFSALEGSHRYCEAATAQKIREAVAALPLHSVHLLGTGDYHYVSLFWLERVGEPFDLVLFDNHPDDQAGAFGEELLSCGGWVADVRKLPNCRRTLWNPDSVSSPYGIYLSIDLDVLSPAYARTNWDQGEMTLEDLLGRLRGIGRDCRIVGVDICGGLEDCPGINDGVIDEILAAFV